MIDLKTDKTAGLLHIRTDHWHLLQLTCDWKWVKFHVCPCTDLVSTSSDPVLTWCWIDYVDNTCMDWGKAITGKIDSLHPTPEPSQAESQSHHKYTAVTNSLSNSQSDTQSHTHSSHRTGQVGILSLLRMVLVMIIQGVFLGFWDWQAITAFCTWTTV